MLVHFCGRPLGLRPNPTLPNDIAAMTPDQRLTNILWERSIRGSAAWRGGRHAVSFSEVSPPHLHWLIYMRGFPPWGLIYDRQAIFAAGGGPVWYARPEQMAALAGAGLEEWAVRFDTTPGRRSDWLHEQEWRLHCESLPATRERGLLAVLVGRPDGLPIRSIPVPTGDMLRDDGTPTMDPAEGRHAEQRLEQRVPWGWPVLRTIRNPETGQLAPLPFL